MDGRLTPVRVPLRTPYIQQAAFGAQYQLAGNLLLEAGYVGTGGVNLFRQIAINQAPLASESRPIFNA